MKKNYKIFAYLIILILIVSSCEKETKNTSGWTSYTSNGLSHGIGSIIIDSRGNKWVTYSGGVMEFDGTNYIAYNDTNSGLVCNMVYCLSSDQQNNIWFGTPNGVSKFNYINNNWNTYLRDTMVDVIAIDKQNNKWFGTRGCGVLKFDGNNWTSFTKSNSGLTSNFISNIAIDIKNNKWSGYEGFGFDLTKFDDIKWNTYTVPNPYSGVGMSGFNSIAIDAQGNVWITIPLSGLFEFDGINWTTYLKGDNVHGFAIDNKGNKWVGYQELWLGGGVSKLNSKYLTHYTVENSGLIDNWITSIAIDSLGNKWFGTGGGLSKFNDN